MQLVGGGDGGGSGELAQVLSRGCSIVLAQQVKMLMLCFNQNRANMAVFMLTSETIRLLKKN